MGLEAGEPGGAARHDRLEAGAARARERARGPRRLPARRAAPATDQSLWIEIYMAARPPARPLSTERVTVTADGKAAPLPVELRGLRLHAAGREQPARDGLLRARASPSSTRAATSTRPTTASRTAIASSSSTPTTRRRSRRTAAASTDATSRRARGYEGPGEGMGNTIVPASFYGPGPRRYEERQSAWKRVRRVDELPEPRSLPKALTLPLPARRALPAAVRRGPQARREHPLATRARGARCPLFVTKRDRPGAPGAPSTSGASRRRPSTSRRRRQRERRQAGASGSTTEAGPQGPTPASSTPPPPRRGW